MKFKHGDKVKIIQRKPGNTTGGMDFGRPNGDVGKVCYISGRYLSENEDGSGDYYGIYDNSNKHCFQDDDLELVSDEFVLPEKWCVKTEKNDDGKLIGKWFNKQSSHGCYARSCLGEYYHSHNLSNQSILNKGNLDACFADGEPRPGYTEITFEQFKQYIMKIFPEKWYIVTTEQNHHILDKWRKQQASKHESRTYVDKTLEVGNPVLSKHIDDNSYFYSSDVYGGFKKKYEGYQEIDLETFLQITEMQKTQMQKSYTVTREQFKQGYELACSEWKEKLMKSVGQNLVLSDETTVSQELIEEMHRAASNSRQKDFLDMLFPDPSLINSRNLKVGEAMRIGKSEGEHAGKIILRTYDSLVDINRPQSTWSGNPGFIGTKVELEIKVIG